MAGNDFIVYITLVMFWRQKNIKQLQSMHFTGCCMDLTSYGCWIEWRYWCDICLALVLGPKPPRQGMCWDFLKFGRSESNSCRSRLGHVRSWRVVPQGKLMWKTENPWFAWSKKMWVFHHATVSLHSVPEISGGKPNIPLILTIVSV